MQHHLTKEGLEESKRELESLKKKVVRKLPNG